MKRYRYWNANGFTICIVAKEGLAKDWAAYIGATATIRYLEQETVSFVERNGCKIERGLAEFLFPDFVEAGLEWRY